MIPEVVFSALLRSSIFGNTWVILGVHYIFGLWGLVFEGFGNLRIQGRMQIFKKISQKALNRILTLPDYSI